MSDKSAVMKKLFLFGLLAVSSVSIFAQEEPTTTPKDPVVETQPIPSSETFNLISAPKEDMSKAIQKEALMLKIRKNVIRPLGKDWYVTISGGYGIPFLSTNKRSPLKEIGDKYWYQHGSQLSVKPLFGTNGGGFALNIGWGHMFNKYIGIDVQHTLAWHPERLDAKMDLDTYYATQKTGTFGIYISPHLIMRWDNGKRFGMTAKAGIVMPLFGKTTTRAYIKDDQGRIIETLGGYPVLPLSLGNLAGLEIELSAKAHTSYNPTVGVSASIGFDVKLNDKLTFFSEIRVQAYTITLKETIFDEFKQTSTINVLGIKIPAPNGLLVIPSNVANAGEAPEFLKHYVYRNEITESSNTARYGFKEIIDLDPNKPQVDINKPMDEPGVKFNASSLYFNAGLRIDFDLWQKKMGKRLDAQKQSKAKPSKSKSIKSKPTKTPKTKEPKQKKAAKTTKVMLDDPDAQIKVQQ